MKFLNIREFKHADKEHWDLNLQVWINIDWGEVRLQKDTDYYLGNDWVYLGTVKSLLVSMGLLVREV